jgi:hypothetical protein
MEWDPGQSENVFVRPCAVRAASGHRSIVILDPERIAPIVTSEVTSHLSGIFHVTEAKYFLSIFTRSSSGGNKMEESMDGCAFLAFLSLGRAKVCGEKALGTKLARQKKSCGCALDENRVFLDRE